MIAADPYTRRVMEEQDYAAKNVEFWKNTIAAVTAEKAVFSNHRFPIPYTPAIENITVRRFPCWKNFRQKNFHVPQKNITFVASK